MASKRPPKMTLKKLMEKAPKGKDLSSKKIKSQPTTPLGFKKKKSGKRSAVDKNSKGKEQPHSAPVSGDEQSEIMSMISGKLANKLKSMSHDKLQEIKDMKSDKLIGKLMRRTASKDTTSDSESASTSSTKNSAISTMAKKMEGNKFLKSALLKSALNEGAAILDAKLKSAEKSGKLKLTPPSLGFAKKKKEKEAIENKESKGQEQPHSAPVSGDERSDIKNVISEQLFNKLKNISQDKLKGIKGMKSDKIFGKLMKQSSSTETNTESESVSTSSTESSELGTMIKKEGDKFMKKALNEGIAILDAKVKSVGQSGKLLPKMMFKGKRNKRSTKSETNSDESASSQPPPKKNKKRRRFWNRKNKKNLRTDQSDVKSVESSEASSSSAASVASSDSTSESISSESETTDENQMQSCPSGEQFEQEISSTTGTETTSSTSTTPSSRLEQQNEYSEMTKVDALENRGQSMSSSDTSRRVVPNKQQIPLKSVNNRITNVQPNQSRSLTLRKDGKNTPGPKQTTSTPDKQKPNTAQDHQKSDEKNSVIAKEPSREALKATTAINADSKANENKENTEVRKNNEGRDIHQSDYLENTDDPEFNLMLFKLAKHMIKDKHSSKSKAETQGENEARDSPTKEKDWLTALDLIRKAQEGRNSCECSRRRRTKHARTRYYCQPYWPCLYHNGVPVGCKVAQDEVSQRDASVTDVTDATESKVEGKELVASTLSQPLPSTMGCNMIGPCPIMGFCVSSYSDSSSSTSSSVESSYLKRQEAKYLCNVIKVLNGHKLPGRKRRSRSLTQRPRETVSVANPCHCKHVSTAPNNVTPVCSPENQQKVSTYPVLPICLPVLSDPNMAFVSPMKVVINSFPPGTSNSASIDFMYG